MDRKIGLPPSGSTMGNNALRIKNKLFAASTMTNLQPHSPAPNYAVPHRAATNSATQHSGVSRREAANTAHIITLNRQNTLSGVNAFETKVLVATRRRRLSGILTRVAGLRGVLVRSRGSHRPSLLLSSTIRRARRSCLSLPTDAARRKSVQTRCEQLTLRCFLPGPLRGQRLVRIP